MQLPLMHLIIIQNTVFHSAEYQLIIYCAILAVYYTTCTTVNMPSTGYTVLYITEL